jgi:hypothetical protein
MAFIRKGYDSTFLALPKEGATKKSRREQLFFFALNRESEIRATLCGFGGSRTCMTRGRLSMKYIA